MQKNKITLWSLSCIIGGLLSAPALPGADTQSSVKSALTGASNLELPSKTAGLIAGATDQNRHGMTVSAVQAAVKMNPAAAPAIVGAVAARVPSAASMAAATAAQLVPDQAARIAGAAAKAAPGEAGAIVAECSKKVPDRYALIAVAASKAAPSANHDILIAASSASPLPVRSQLVSMADASRMTPVDVAIVHAYKFHGPDFDRDDSHRGNGRGGDWDRNFPGGSHAGHVLDPSYDWWGPHRHSGCPVFGH